MTTPTILEGRRAPPIALAWVVPVVLVAAALVALYGRVFQGLVAVWTHVSYFSYGFLVPLWSAWLVLTARSRVAAIPRRRDVSGLALVAVGLAALAVADAHVNLTLATLSLPVVLIGLGRFALGREAFRPLAFPVAFLALMAPLPPQVLPPISLFLQQLAATFAVVVLEAVRIPVVRDGLLLQLGPVALFIAEACNGLRFLLAMVVLGVAFAWAVNRGLAVRLLVFTVTLTAAIAANLIRVSGTALLVHFWGPTAALGLFHNLFGKAIYLLTVALCLLLVRHLRRHTPPQIAP